jgi:hypothetical protein
MNLGFAEKVGIFLSLVLIILFGSIGSSRTFVSEEEGQGNSSTSQSFNQLDTIM